MSHLAVVLTALALVGAACGGTTATTTTVGATTITTGPAAATTTLAVTTTVAAPALPIVEPSSPPSLAELAEFEVPAGHAGQTVLAPPFASPLSFAISSTDDIVMTDHAGQGIYRVHEDGSVTEYADRVSIRVGAIVFDSADNLYVTGGEALWRIAPDGVISHVADGVHNNYQLAVGPSGDVFAVGPTSTDVQRITPDGRVSIYASGMSSAASVAVHPITGDVFVSDWGAGAIVKANVDGTTTLFSAGEPGENGFIAFSSDGKLYLSIGGVLALVSTEDGTRTILPWAGAAGGEDCDIHHALIAVDRRGRVLNGGFTDNHIVRFDPATETIELLVRGLTNTPALAVAPHGGGVFLGNAHPLCSGNGTISRIEADGSLTAIVDDLPNLVSSIAIDEEVTGYVSAGGQVYTFTADGALDLLIEEQIGNQDLSVNPQTGVLWGGDQSGLWYWDSAGHRVTIPYPFPQRHSNPSIVFTSEGLLYFEACTGPDDGADHLGIHRFDPTSSSFSLVVEIDTEPGSGCFAGSVAADGDGNIYWFIDEVLQIAPSGKVAPFGTIWGDAKAIAGDPDSTDIYFTTAVGVYRVIEE